MISVKQIFLWAGWCVLALQFQSWSDNHFFWQFSVGQMHFGRCILAPCGAHKCFEMLYFKKKKRKSIAISIRTSTTAAKVVIFLVKLRFLFPLLRAIRCPRHETGSGKKKESNLEWQSKTARPCIGSHTFLIDGSWLLPTKRLFRSAANFDFHDNRPKMADLKSVYRLKPMAQICLIAGESLMLLCCTHFPIHKNRLASIFCFDSVTSYHGVKGRV